eukprot:scaffold616058_cov17-Prasinocladus_malaysianus.AAC.1
MNASEEATHRCQHGGMQVLAESSTTLHHDVFEVRSLHASLNRAADVSIEPRGVSSIILLASFVIQQPQPGFAIFFDIILGALNDRRAP